MMDRWTHRQRDAIEHRGGNVLLSAAAGSGKTSVLVARALGLVLDSEQPIDIDRLLIVTFTEAAAREMRMRIASRLQEVRAEGVAGLERQLALVARAQISTIHAFCLGVVRRSCFELALDPAFGILDEPDALILREDALTATVEEMLARPGMVELATRYRGIHPGGLVWGAALAVYDMARSQPDPSGWLDRAAAMYTGFADIPGDSPWARTLLQHYSRILSSARDRLTRAHRLAGSAGGPGPYDPSIAGEIAQVNQMIDACRSGDWGRFAVCCRTEIFGRLPSSRGADRDIVDRVKRLRDRSKRDVKDCIALGCVQDASLAAGLEDAGRSVGALIGLVRAFGRRYDETKRRLGRLDFHDIELLCLEALNRPGPDRGSNELIGELQKRYEHILIDEYQDTNPLQDAILNRIGRDSGNLFAVGDVRQSIYRFRLAEPGLFMDRMSRYGEDPAAGLAIELEHNFRSRSNVIAAVNFTFRHLFDAELGWTGGDLIAAADFPDSRDDPPVELTLIERGPGDGGDGEDDDGGDWDDLPALEREAVAAGMRIRELVGVEKVWDRDHVRPAKYGDVAILLRATRLRAEVVAGTLAEMGIPAYADTRTGLFDAPEVITFIALLQVIDNPRQDIPLAGVMRSVFGLSCDQLARCRPSRGQDLYDGVVREAETIEPCREIVELIKSWREPRSRLPVAELIVRLWRDTRYYDYVGGLPAGAARRANLRAIFDLARRFERSGGVGLSRFLELIERWRTAGEDLGAAPVVGEGDDVVRVISVHGSKGLEFPIVIVMDLGRRLQARAPGRLDVHRELGVGAAVVQPELHAAYPSLASAAVAAARSLDERAEEVRILYVAMTRAKERLILIGSVHNLDRAIGSWRDTAEVSGWTLGAPAILGAATYLDLIVPAVLRHCTGVPDGVMPVAAPDDVRMFPCRWRVTVTTGPASVVVSTGPQGDPQVDPPDMALIAERLSWAPDDTGWDRVAAKVGASELKRRYDAGHEDSVAWDREPGRRSWVVPRIVWGEEADMRLRGVALHRFLQHVDLTSPLDPQGLRLQIDDLVDRELLATSQAELIDIEAVARMLGSGIGRRLTENPDGVWREIPFSMALSAPRVYPGVAPGGPPVLVQGVIDCVIVDADGVEIVDFKHSPPGGDRRERERKYADQLAIYGQAAARMFGLPVRRASIVYVSTNEVFVPEPVVAGTGND